MSEGTRHHSPSDGHRHLGPDRPTPQNGGHTTAEWVWRPASPKTEWSTLLAVDHHHQQLVEAGGGGHVPHHSEHPLDPGTRCRRWWRRSKSASRTATITTNTINTQGTTQKLLVYRSSMRPATS